MEGTHNSEKKTRKASEAKNRDLMQTYEFAKENKIAKTKRKTDVLKSCGEKTISVPCFALGVFADKRAFSQNKQQVLYMKFSIIYTAFVEV